MATPAFNIWTDFAATVELFTVDADGVVIALTTGSCTCFMAPTHDTDAAMPTDAPEGVCVYSATAGAWVITIQGEEFDPAICDVMFAKPATPYLHVRNAKNVRVAVRCSYERDLVVAAA